MKDRLEILVPMCTLLMRSDNLIEEIDISANNYKLNQIIVNYSKTNKKKNLNTNSMLGTEIIKFRISVRSFLSLMYFYVDERYIHS